MSSFRVVFCFIVLTLGISDDGLAWREVLGIENDCSAPSEAWREHSLTGSVDTRHIRIKILANCGDPNYLTLRGVRFK